LKALSSARFSVKDPAFGRGDVKAGFRAMNHSGGGRFFTVHQANRRNGERKESADVHSSFHVI
jgi:hypothetical protein